ncbi:MAG: 50S ribosomal protein L19e [Candidatus Woesearchaeota archaeon]|nr:MAG: 50S ribosomal protein L19e [Candidatus Woesearchaeota archaeon]
MNLRVQRRIAASVLGVGLKKVRFDPERLNDIKEAITKSDIRSLISNKVIIAKQDKGTSKFRVRKIKLQKRKGRRKGQGSRKGTFKARTDIKSVWISRLRIQRAFIRNLKEKNLITSKDYKTLMLKAKGGFFRSKRHIKIYLGEHNLIIKK